jgi:1-acyl-sn-glycerol-3-phosphate acyltransferase
LLACVVHIARGALICALVFPRRTAAQRMQIVGWWSVSLLSQLGIRVTVNGAPQPGPVLLASNHISWIDILVINAVQPARFVSKADVRAWPLLGWVVACGGTLFIERERKRDALRVVHQVAAALTAGDTIAMFPEGTTGDGRSLLPFHANLLQAAVATSSPVQGIALRYSDAAGERSQAVVWIGDMTLAASLWTVAMTDRLHAHVALLPVDAAAEGDRRALAERLRSRIAQAIGVGDAPPVAH